MVTTPRDSRRAESLPAGDADNGLEHGTCADLYGIFADTRLLSAVDRPAADTWVEGDRHVVTPDRVSGFGTKRIILYLSVS